MKLLRDDDEEQFLQQCAEPDAGTPPLEDVPGVLIAPIEDALRVAPPMGDRPTAACTIQRRQLQEAVRDLAYYDGERKERDAFKSVLPYRDIQGNRVLMDRRRTNTQELRTPGTDTLRVSYALPASRFPK